MILGLGIDLTDSQRIRASVERFGERFLDRIFTTGERAMVERRKGAEQNYYGSYAKRFAAKEAAGKALGTGVGQGISWQHIEVQSNALGAPQLVLHGSARDRLLALTPVGYRPQVHLALTDEGAMAMAQVILSAIKDEAPS